MTTIASLVTELSFEVTRGAEAVAAVERIQRAVEVLGSSASRITGQLQQTADSIRQVEGSSSLAAVEIDLLGRRVDETSQKLNAAKGRVDEARAALDRLGGEAAGRTAADRIRQLGEELVALEEKMRSTGKATAEEFARMSAIPDQIASLQELANAFVKVGKEDEEFNRILREMIRLLKEAEAASLRLSPVLGPPRPRGLMTPEELRRRYADASVQGPPTPPRPPGGGVGGFNRTELTSLLSMLRSGNISATALTQVLFRLGATAMKALLPIAGALAPAIAGFAFLKSRVGELVQQIQTSRPEVQGLAADFKSLGAIDLGGLLTQLDSTFNLLRSMNATDPGATTGQIAQIADITQFLDARPNNLNQAIQAIEQSLRTLNFESLRQFGFEVDNLDAEFKKLAEEGIGQAELRTRALAALGTQALDRSAEAARQAGAEYMTLQGIIDSIKEGVNRLALNPEIQAATTNLIAAFASLDAIIKSLTGTMEGGFATVIDKIADGFRALMFVAHGLIATVGAVAEVLGTIEEKVTGNTWLKNWGQNAVAAANSSHDLMMAVRAMVTDFSHMEPVERATLAITYLAQQGSLTAVALGQIQSVAGITAEEMRLIEQRAVASAHELGLNAAAVKSVRDAFRSWSETMPAVDNSLAGFAPTIGDASDALKKFYSDINQGQSIVETVKGFAVAWDEMNNSLTVSSAVNALGQLNRVIEMVAINGMESFELLRLQAQAAFEVGLINEAELNKAIEGYDAVAAVVAPIAENMEEVRNRMKAAATDNGLNTLQTDVVNTGNAALTFAGNLGQATAAIQVLQAQAAQGVHMPFTTSVSMGGLAGGGGGVRTSPTTRGPVRVTGVTADPGRGVRPPGTPTVLSRNDISTSGRRDEAGAAPPRPPAAPGPKPEIALDNAVGNLLDAFGLGKKGGGGGGGGSAADDFAVTLEQIRALMRAVNEAIAIGIRGGVRIGTEGNVVPFEPGTFLNAQGGMLTVDTIVIRGVWDFADPATRRQIVKELEQALRELKDEL